MPSSREVDAVLQVLNSPEHEGEPSEKVIAAAIQALDEVRARSRRLAVVGQITFGPQDATHTVVLGPFSARGYLDSEAKFAKAVAGGSAARQAGQDLAWDPKTTRGRGRFMLVPAFTSPRDAWDFFRADKLPEDELPRLTTKMLLEGTWRHTQGMAKVLHDVERWRPDLWGEELAAKGIGGPTCICGLKPGSAERCQVPGHGSTRRAA